MKTFQELREAVGDVAIAHQTPYGTVTATKRNTKGMRGKQDGYSLSLKTKSGKVVDLGSHPKPTKANVMSLVKNVMQKESVDLEENKIFFVKVGDGRGSMTIKTKATNSREALKKMRSEHPKSRVSLDINQKQGQPAGALESVKTEDLVDENIQKTADQFGVASQMKKGRNPNAKVGANRQARRDAYKKDLARRGIKK